MGLDTTHDCWHGAYSSFMKWRKALCRAAGRGDLLSYVGFGGDRAWPDPSIEPLVHLLNHSDCEGYLEVEQLMPIADRLDELQPELRDIDNTDHCNGPWSHAEKARAFAAGCRLAASLGERVEFH
jgi:hypothetical protein